MIKKGRPHIDVDINKPFFGVFIVNNLTLSF